MACITAVTSVVADIVSRWRILEAQTSSLQQDCQQLYLLHLDCVHTEHELELLKRSISFDKFDDIRVVEIALRTTQVITQVTTQVMASD